MDTSQAPGLVIDNRHSGDSGGQPRQLADLHRQLEDIQASVGYARSRMTSTVSGARTTARVAADMTAAVFGREPTYMPLVGPARLVSGHDLR